MGRAAVNRSVRIVAKVMNNNQRMFLCAPLASARGPQRVRGQSARESCNGNFRPIDTASLPAESAYDG